MNRSILFLLLFSCLITACAQNKQNNKKEFIVTIKTSHGDMVAILYDETPKHKANFIKLAKAKYYDSLLFHRVIQEFMIQGGDPDSKKAVAGQALGRGGPGYTVDAEFNPKFIHEKGALSAARLGGPANPAKASSGSQFYVVQGKKMSESELTQLEQNVNNTRKNEYLREIIMMPKYEALRAQINERQQAQDVPWLNSFFEKSDTLIQKEKPGYQPFAYSPEQREVYTKIGGTPFLDRDYTVFGKVIKGLEVIDKIAALPKGPSDRPTEDIRMFVTVGEMTRKKIEKEYGYIFPENK